MKKVYFTLAITFQIYGRENPTSELDTLNFPFNFSFELVGKILTILGRAQILIRK